MSRARASVGFSPMRWNGARKMPNFIPWWAMRSPCGSAGRLPGVDREDLARDVARERTAQERGGRRDVVRSGHPLERRALDQRLAHGVDRDAPHLGLTLDDAVDAIALDGAWGDAVDGDVVRRQLQGHAVGHPDLAGLGRAVADARGARDAPPPTRC